jgi:hypothetical protein
MEKLTSEKIKEWIAVEEDDFYIDKFREKRGIDPDSSVFYTTISRMVDSNELRRKGRGLYHKIKRVVPVPVYSVQRERKEPFKLFFPTDFDTSQEFGFAEHVVVRNGDCILIAGESNWGKTTLAMQFLAQNIEYNPVLLGNEFTKDNEPTPRFLNRLDTFKESGIVWIDENGNDRFSLIPVYQDFAENIIRDRINIIDWINIETGEHYLIGNIMQDIKRAVGQGIAIIVIQKQAGAEAGRGGQFTKDFADLELLVDKHSNTESRLTIGKCKEYTQLITGRSWAYGITKGVFLRDVREVIKCPKCYGKGWRKEGQLNRPCDTCQKSGWVTK